MKQAGAEAEEGGPEVVARKRRRWERVVEGPPRPRLRAFQVGPGRVERRKLKKEAAGGLGPKAFQTGDLGRGTPDEGQDPTLGLAEEADADESNADLEAEEDEMREEVDQDGNWFDDDQVRYR